MLFFAYVKLSIFCFISCTQTPPPPCAIVAWRASLTFNNSIRCRQLRIIIRFVFRHFQSNVLLFLSFLSLMVRCCSRRSTALPQNRRLQWYRSLLSLSRNTCSRVTNFSAVTVAPSDFQLYCSERVSLSLTHTPPCTSQLVQPNLPSTLDTPTSSIPFLIGQKEPGALEY